jgi:hypothetical protein
MKNGSRHSRTCRGTACRPLAVTPLTNRGQGTPYPYTVSEKRRISAAKSVTAEIRRFAQNDRRQGSHECG